MTALDAAALAAPAPPQSSGTGASELALRVKAVQRQSKWHNVVWQRYCLAAGHPRLHDPSRHPEEFLSEFLHGLEEGAFDDMCEGGLAAKEGQSTFIPRTVPAADVAAAQARLAAATGEGVWELLPPRWQPLFRKPRRFSYDAGRYDFVAAIREMLDCPEGVPLSRLHEVQRPLEYEPCPPLLKGMQLAGVELPPAKTAHRAKNRCNRVWRSSPAYRRFMDLYLRFIREVVMPDFCVPPGDSAQVTEDILEAAVQATPILRVVMPSQHISTAPHRDRDYGHVPEEVNFWMPLTPVFGSNSLFIESFPGRGDFAPLEGEAGHVFRLWANQCSHYAEANGTDVTRVSLDFRIIPREFWDASDAVGALKVAQERRTFYHDGELTLGSYYRWETAKRVVEGAPASVPPPPDES